MKESLTRAVVVVSAFLAGAWPGIRGGGLRADEPPPWLSPAAPRVIPTATTDGDREAEPIALPFVPWEPCKVKTANEGLLGSLSSSVVVTDLGQGRNWDDPLWQRRWQRDDNWNCTLAGPLYVFGQVGANSGEAAQADMKVIGKTGVGCKVPLGQDAEVLVRSGPSVTYTDPLRPDKTLERSEWLLEVQARYPLIWGIGLEYQGIASPALTPQDRDKFNQDLRLAFPLGTNGKFRVGAKHKWEYTTDPRPLPDAMQVYLGVELTH